MSTVWRHLFRGARNQLIVETNICLMFMTIRIANKNISLSVRDLISHNPNPRKVLSSFFYHLSHSYRLFYRKARSVWHRCHHQTNLWLLVDHRRIGWHLRANCPDIKHGFRRVWICKISLIPACIYSGGCFSVQSDPQSRPEVHWPRVLPSGVWLPGNRRQDQRNHAVTAEPGWDR